MAIRIKKISYGPDLQKNNSKFLKTQKIFFFPKKFSPNFQYPDISIVIKKIV